MSLVKTFFAKNVQGEMTPAKRDNPLIAYPFLTSPRGVIKLPANRRGEAMPKPAALTTRIGITIRNFTIF